MRWLAFVLLLVACDGRPVCGPWVGKVRWVPESTDCGFTLDHWPLEDEFEIPDRCVALDRVDKRVDGSTWVYTAVFVDGVLDATLSIETSCSVLYRAEVLP